MVRHMAGAADSKIRISPLLSNRIGIVRSNLEASQVPGLQLYFFGREIYCYYRPPLGEAGDLVMSQSVRLSIRMFVHCVWKKHPIIFLIITPTFLGHFLYFCTTGNRNDE